MQSDWEEGEELFEGIVSVVLISPLVSQAFRAGICCGCEVPQPWLCRLRVPEPARVSLTQLSPLELEIK